MEFLAWPVVGLVLGIFALLIFRKPITRFIDRAEKVSKDGIQARAAEQQQKEIPPSKVEEFLKVHENQLLLETERIAKEGLDALQPRDAEEREKFLLRNFAAVVISQSFDRTYYWIYGSQIIALQYLNDNRMLAQTTENVRPFYDDAVQMFPTFYSNYPFEGWLAYLVSSGLVQKNGNDIGITIRGKEFLKYLVEQGYTLAKPG